MANALTLEDMLPGLAKGVERAQREPAGRFHALAHLIDVPALTRAYCRQRSDAPGKGQPTGARGRASAPSRLAARDAAGDERPWAWARDRDAAGVGDGLQMSAVVGRG